MPPQDPYADIATPDPYADIATGAEAAADYTPPVTRPEVSQEPTGWNMRHAKSLAYRGANSALDLLPTVGGIVGGTIGAGSGVLSGPGVAATTAIGAAFGGEAGEAARQLGKRALFGTGPQTSSEAATEMTRQGGIQAASELSGRVLAKGFSPAISYLDRTAMQSAKSGVRLLPSEAHGTSSSYLERFLKGSVLTSGKMEAFRTAQNEQTKAAAEKVAAQISGFNGSAEQLGQMVQKGIAEHTEQFRSIQNQMYADIDKAVAEQVTHVPVQQQATSSLVDASGKPLTYSKTVMQKQITGPAMPSMKLLKDFASAELKKLSSEEQVLDPALLSSTRNMLENIVKAPDNVPYRAMAAARSDMLALTRRLDEALPGKQAGFAKKMASLADESMMKAAEDSGIPGLPGRIRAANAFTANEHAMFEQALIKKVVETKKPEAIAKFVRSPNVGLQETRDLFKIMSPALRPAVQKQVVSDVMRDSVNAQTGAFNERKFATAITKLGDERGAEIFGTNWKNVKQLSELMGRINGPTGITGGSGAALQNFAVLKNMMLTVAAPFGLAASHKPLAAGGTLVAEWATLNTLAAAMIHPETAVKMLKVGQMFAKNLPYAATGATNVAKDKYGPKTKKLDTIREQYASQ